ncbi:taxadiene 5-alpha hydroxylase-like isoform X2 [Prunus yedoensis var. nudiflora]|uniref:Taxadiene 5-alpha hydroxylase-like isoform X2 n=1 Tax=Prunus yedoensis var. nudiflora TaxID=2094558 RepID=A0A314UTP1_PRUYE|nr:taxadiene 5-alpha hydroxylase-like isoform X2 [Prunus yedoensis var. nudiflora]
MGSPTVVVVGQAGNKFVLGAEDDVLAAKQPVTLVAIAGKQNIFELTGSRYRLVKGAMDEHTKEVLFDDFSLAFKAVWSLPVNFPGTVYWRGLRARSRIQSDFANTQGKKGGDFKGHIERYKQCVLLLASIKR